jgi:hypothetical protein
MDADEYVWMTCVFSAWRRDARMKSAVDSYQIYCGKNRNSTFEEIRGLKSGGDVNSLIDAKVWLARYYQPVSEALWDGVDDARAMKVWSKTKRCNSIGMGRELVSRHNMGRYASNKNTAAAISASKFAWGWKSKSDWKVVK